MRRIADNALPKAGEFSWHLKTDGARYLYFCCPTPSACLHGLPVHAMSRTRWNWDGNDDKPSLTPSVQCLVDGCRWHGYITNGELVGV